MLLSFWRRTGRAMVFGLISLLALALVAAACGDEGEDVGVADGEPIERSPQTPIVIPADEPIVVGVSAALTGPTAGLGTESRDAAVLGVERWKAANGDQIAGHDIEVRAQDDGCFEADITVNAAERLLRVKGLVGVIGPMCSTGAEAVIPTYSEAGIVMISGSATSTILTGDQPEGRFFFRTAYRNDLEGTFIGLFLSSSPELGIESVYLIDDGETYGEDLASNAQRIAEEGGVLVTRESIVTGTVDFSDVVRRIVQANPDFVAFAGFNPEAALLYRQLRDAGYDRPFGAGDGAASVTEFVEPVGELAEGVLFAGCKLAFGDDVLAEFVDLHDHEPVTAFAAQYVDAATVLMDAVAAVAEGQDDGSLAIDPIELRKAVRGTVLDDGLSGAIAFDENGDRRPPGAASLTQFVNDALANQDATGYVDLGLVPCQVQNGRLVNLLGPGAGEIRLP